MNTVEEFSRVVLFLLLGLFILHVVNGSGGWKWIASKFQVTGGPRT